MNHQQRRAYEAVRAARKQWGAGWRHLSEEQQKGAVALSIVHLLMNLDENASADALKRLQEVAEIAFGLV